MNELKNPGKTLIDKVSLWNCEIVDIEDVKSLINMDNATYTADKEGNFITSKGEEYTSIYISDDNIAYFSYRHNLYDKSFYSRLDLAVKHEGEIDNLNCDDVDGLNLRVSNAIVYLYEHYGISISAEKATISKIEINKTIVTDKPFNDYFLSLRTFTQNISSDKRMDVNAMFFNRIDGTEKIGTIYGKSKSLNNKPHREFKFYDKTVERASKVKKDTETDDTDVSDKYYMRLEFTLNGSKTISKIFDTNLLSEIDDTMINKYFNKYFDEYFNAPTKRFLKKQQKAILNEFTKYYSENPRNKRKHIESYIMKTFDKERSENVILLLDGKQIIEALNNLKYKRKDSRQEKYRTIKMAKEILSNTKSLNGNMDLLNEIIDKFIS